jgi:myo-inositol-1(or 4)-monophosphatase
MTLRASGFWPETLLAIETMEAALVIARSGIGAQDITAKGERDLVTETDLAVEDAIRDLIGVPLGFPIVGEERGGEAPTDGSPYWLVDPICGTRNFASRIPLYCINLALVEDGGVTVAVVGNPAIDEIHVAERDRGAWAVKEGFRRRLTSIDESGIIVIEDATTKGDRRERVAGFTAAVIRADRWDFRSFGTSLSLSYLAAGQIAAYVLFSSSAVHFGAGSLLVTEAGAILTDIDGRPWTIRSDSAIVSASSDLHRVLLELARTASPSGPRIPTS